MTFFFVQKLFKNVYKIIFSQELILLHVKKPFNATYDIDKMKLFTFL